MVSIDPTVCFTCGKHLNNPVHDTDRPGSHEFKRVVVLPPSPRKMWPRVVGGLVMVIVFTLLVVTSCPGR
jgi:hypothetical protein